jgi:primosomal protein N' (replication factor Y)
VTDEHCVDVVVDVAAARLDSPFTYLSDSFDPHPGARVRVPFGNRSVAGWVVSAVRPVAGADGLKAILSVEDGSPRLDENALSLADWMRRRYACSFREAILAVASRTGSRERAASFAFVMEPEPGDAAGRALYQRFEKKLFSAIAARRALRSGGRNVALREVLKELAQLCRAGALERLQAPARRAVAARRTWFVRIGARENASNAAQQRLVDVLSAQPEGLPVVEAARRASTSAQVVRRAAASGVCVLEEWRGGTSSAEAGQTRSAHEPTAEQSAAIDAIDGAMREPGSAVLLHGITGSGKTLVYARSIGRLRERGGRAIVLVPEISLTPQTAGYFEALYGSRVGVLHSGLSDGDRARVLEDAMRGRIDVVIGARSAVFAPLPELRLIVIDEEHEPSYKQDVAPRYDTAAVARERMRVAGGTVVLGSATPSLETYLAAKVGEIRYVRLAGRATNAPLPPVEIVDMSAQRSQRTRGPLGPALIAAMDAALARGEKTLLFVNRRGYAGLLLCRACGFAPKCRRCAVSLVIHIPDGSMRCHVCGDAYRMATTCPKCRSADLKPFGFGTQRVEEEVRALFPEAGVVRMDSDTTGRRGAHGALLETFGSNADVLIGTQMIAKGLDFPSVTVVGVVSADIDLHRPDFRAAERTFELLTQVAGRAGRAAPGARVIVQTYSPEHYAIRLASMHDYDGFAQRELALRKELHYPPYGRLAYLAIAGADRDAVGLAATAVGLSLRGGSHGVEVLGPAPEPLAKARGEYRMRIAIKADDLAPLLAACDAARAFALPAGVGLSAIVDPR